MRPRPVILRFGPTSDGTGVTTTLTLTLVRRSGRYSFTATAFGVTFMRGS